MDDPSSSPASGNTNFTQGILVVAIVTTTISAIVALLRFATRVWIVKRLGWDDYTMMLAMCGTMVGMAVVAVEVHYGFGRHKAYLTPHQVLEFQKYTWGEWIQTFATLMWTKVSICLFLMRIPVTKWLIRPLQAALVILIVSNVILTILWIVQCRPVAAAWDESLHGVCFSKDQVRSIIFAQAIISVVSDFAFAAYPILILWGIQINWKTKVGLCCLMGLGVITGVCCIVRTVLNGGAIPDDDVSYGGLINWIWRDFEVHIGIIAACIPALRPGYKWLCQMLSPSRKASSIHIPLTNNPKYRKNHFEQDSSMAIPPSAYPTQERKLGLSGNNILKTTTLDVEEGLA